MYKTTIYDTEGYKLISISNGEAYSLENKSLASPIGSRGGLVNVFVQGRNARKFQSDLEALIVGRGGPVLAVEDALRIMWDSLSSERAVVREDRGSLNFYEGYLEALLFVAPLSLKTRRKA